MARRLHHTGTSNASGVLCGPARAQEGLDFFGGAGEGEEVALADAAAAVGEELALRVVLDAFGDDFELHPTRRSDEGAPEAGALGIGRDAGDELAIDADGIDLQALQERQRGEAGAE